MTRTPQPGKGLTTQENFRTCHLNKAPRSVFKNKQTESGSRERTVRRPGGFIPGTQGWLSVQRANCIARHVDEQNPHDGADRRALNTTAIATEHCGPWRETANGNEELGPPCPHGTANACPFLPENEQKPHNRRGSQSAGKEEGKR